MRMPCLCVPDQWLRSSGTPTSAADRRSCTAKGRAACSERDKIARYDMHVCGSIEEKELGSGEAFGQRCPWNGERHIHVECQLGKRRCESGSTNKCSPGSERG